MKKDKLKQYNGFLNTPNLWKGSVLKGLQQFNLPSKIYPISDFKRFNEVRLGKRVEQFFFFQIENSSAYELLASNLQIRQGKLTIGEIDALIKSEAEYLHIEIIYKFYLYDPNIESTDELDKWIGPNRKDTLKYKLNKLIEKQLPLLYSEHTKNELDKLKLKSKDLFQNVYYKAQLFLPFQTKTNDINPLNSDCIVGYYIHKAQLNHLESFVIYIPDKLDWLSIPNETKYFKEFDAIKSELLALLANQNAPLLWLKSRSGKLSRCFLVWW